MIKPTIYVTGSEDSCGDYILHADWSIWVRSSKWAWWRGEFVARSGELKGSGTIYYWIPEGLRASTYIDKLCTDAVWRHKHGYES